MDEIDALEAKNKLAELLDRAERGVEIVITRHGRPAARLVPSGAGADESGARIAVERLRARARKLNGGAFDWETFKADRDAGRP